MAVYEFEERIPQIAQSAYIAPSAQVIGDVRIGEGCYIGHGSILRGDYGTIFIGDGSAVEEGVIIHARPGDQTYIGKNVTLGHEAMIHNAHIEDNAVIGMRATISDYSKVGEWVIIGEAGLVKNGQEVPAGKIAVGAPVEIVGDTRDEHKFMWSMGKEIYQDLARRYPEGLKLIDDNTAKKQSK